MVSATPTGRNRERPPEHAPTHTPVSTFVCVSVSSVVVKSTLIYKKYLTSPIKGERSNIYESSSRKYL